MTMFDQLIAHAAELVLVIGPERRVRRAWGSDPVTGRSADQFVNHPGLVYTADAADEGDSHDLGVVSCYQIKPDDQ